MTAPQTLADNKYFPLTTVRGFILMQLLCFLYRNFGPFTTILFLLSGGRGIRTHETFLPTGFQDQLHRPLGQPSVEDSMAPVLALS